MAETAVGTVATAWSRGEPEVAARPRPDLSGALVAAGGVLIVIGALAVGLDGLDHQAAEAIGLGAVLAIAGWGVLAVLPRFLRPAGVVLVAGGLGELAVGLAFDPSSTEGATGVLALAGLLWFGAWCAPHTRGRPLLLALALTAGWLLVVDASSDQLSATTFAFAGDELTPGIVSLLLGAGLLLAAAALDRDGRAGLATPFLAVGDVAAVAGALLAAQAQEQEVVAAVLVALVGLAVGLVGHRGGRRLSTWLGAALVGGAVLGLGSVIAGDDASTGEEAAIAIVLGIALLSAAAVVPARWPSTGRAATTDAAPAPATAAAAAAAATAATDAHAAWRPPAGAAHPAPPVVQRDVDPELTVQRVRLSAGPAWRPDPTGRFAQRWWDGRAWTEHVADAAGRAAIDEGPVPG